MSVRYVRSKYGYLRPFDLVSDYYVLKSDLIYKDDPSGGELIHSVGSLFEDNYHKVAGAGDCDDFSVLGCSFLLVAGFRCGYAFQGNGRDPEHITPVVYLSGNWWPFDFVAERPFVWLGGYRWNQIFEFEAL